MFEVVDRIHQYRRRTIHFHFVCIMSKSPKKDTTYTKLFVGNIPYGTNDETLRSYFAQFGLIEEAVVIRSKNDNASKGYGFVSILF